MVFSSRENESVFTRLVGRTVDQNSAVKGRVKSVDKYQKEANEFFDSLSRKEFIEMLTEAGLEVIENGEGRIILKDEVEVINLLDVAISEINYALKSNKSEEVKKHYLENAINFINMAKDKFNA